MKITKVLLGLGTALVIALSTLGSKAYATNKCDITGTALGAWGSTFSIHDGKITSRFTVNGKDCTMLVSLVTWKAKSANGQPLYEQKIYDYKTKSFGPGDHKLTVKLPDCYYQADLMVGTKSDWAEADNTPKRITEWKDMGLRDFKIGGDKKCVEKPTPTPTPTPTPPQVQGAVTTLPNTGLSLGSIFGLGFSVSVLGALVHQQIQKRFARS